MKKKIKPKHQIIIDYIEAKNPTQRKHSFPLLSNDYDKILEGVDMSPRELFKYCNEMEKLGLCEKPIQNTLKYTVSLI